MTKINVIQDCGNAPKSLLLRDFNIAFANNRLEEMLDMLTEDIVMNMVGDQKIEGKADLRYFLSQIMDGSISEFTLKEFFTHGRSGTVQGSFIMKDGTEYEFCDVYRFKSVAGKKISMITSFVIKK